MGCVGGSMKSEKTRVGSKSSQEIQAVREAPLPLLVPEGHRINREAYVRWREDAFEAAPELIAWVRR